MCGECSTHARRGKYIQSFSQKIWRLERLGHKLEDDMSDIIWLLSHEFYRLQMVRNDFRVSIEMDVKNWVWELNSSGWAQGTLAGFSEHCNKREIFCSYGGDCADEYVLWCCIVLTRYLEHNVRENSHLHANELLVHINGGKYRDCWTTVNFSEGLCPMYLVV